MNKRTCKQCAHFRQHYVLTSSSAFPLECGHCVFPQLKKRTASTAACARFEEKTVPDDLPDRDAVLHFLTVDMMQHILQLSLPPVIADEE